MCEQALLDQAHDAAETIRQKYENAAQAEQIHRALEQVRAAAAVRLERLETAQAAASLQLKGDYYKG